ncbi:MAG: hypothetical protein AMXMBFR82_14000 [Candidatus Hydrogenedentota bacterium]
MESEIGSDDSGIDILPAVTVFQIGVSVSISNVRSQIQTTGYQDLVQAEERRPEH